MHVRPPILVGTCIGIAGALLVMGYARNRQPERATMLPDEGGAVRAVVMQYNRDSQYVVPVFRDYLKHQPPETTAYVACPAEEDFNELVQLLGTDAGKAKLTPVYTGHEMTAWSRDRWVALVREKDERVTLLSPKGENGMEAWPERAGDSRVGEDLARLLPAVFSARRSNLYFDGGDYLADDGRLFVTRGVIQRNIQHTATDLADLSAQIAAETGLQPVFLPDGPDHHAGMFMMSAGVPGTSRARRVMVVADPSLGKAHYISSRESDALFSEGPDFSAETQKRFDSVALACEKEGFRVVRIPVVAGHGMMYMTYVNVILDRTTEGKPLVYMSAYDGQEALNAAGEAVWRSLGFEVRRVNCTTVWQKGGTLHCLVNVVKRAQ